MNKWLMDGLKPHRDNGYESSAMFGKGTTNGSTLACSKDNVF